MESGSKPVSGSAQLAALKTVSMNFHRRFLSLLFLIATTCFLLQRPAKAQENQDNQPHIQPRVDPNTPSRPSKTKKAGKPATPAPTPAATQPDSTSLPPEEQGESSSVDSQIDLNAHPLNDAGGSRAAEDADALPYDPHRAVKDIEVGNYYLKHKNYRAALERFHDALLYKPNDAEATFGLAVTQEHMDLLAQAYKNYSKYLEILHDGPMSAQAREALQRIEPQLDKNAGDSDSARQAARALEQGENFLAQNDYEAAHLRFEDAMRLTPEDPQVYFRLAQSLQGLQRLDTARMYYKKYLDLQPGGPFATDARKSIEQISAVLGK